MIYLNKQGITLLYFVLVLLQHFTEGEDYQSDVMVFSSMLEDCDVTNIKLIVEQVISFLIELLRDRI